jgi:hypothetical protein
VSRQIHRFNTAPPSLPLRNHRTEARTRLVLCALGLTRGRRASSYLKMDRARTASLRMTTLRPRRRRFDRLHEDAGPCWL